MVSVILSVHSSDGNIQPECRYCIYNEGSQPCGNGNGRRDLTGSRTDSEVFFFTDNDSLLCTRRCDNLGICIDHNDRYQTDHNGADGFPQYNSSRTCGCSRNGCDTGKCVSGTVPGMGNDDLWKITGGTCNDRSNCVKLNTSENTKES